MSDKLVTVATFGTPIEANLVRGRLDAEGIRSFISDEATVGVAWHLGGALGGVKLQVAERDAERAVAAMRADADATIDEDEWKSEDADGERADDREELGDVETATPADQIVARALRAAVLGLLFAPVQFYSLYLLARATLDRSRVSRSHRWRFAVALLLDLPFTLLALWFVWILLVG